MLGLGQKIGIIGGGQLGKMLAQAAASYGFIVSIYTDSDVDQPATEVVSKVVRGAYTDVERLRVFAETVDVLTYETEDLPVESLERAKLDYKIRPCLEALKVIQDRFSEKRYLERLKLSTAPYALVRSFNDVERFVKESREVCILKSRRSGYDGKGQHVVSTLDEAHAIFAMDASVFENNNFIIEKKVDFTHELSLILCRSANGSVEFYPVSINVHEKQVLRFSMIEESLIPQSLRSQIEQIGTVIIKSFNYIGIMCVEFFYNMHTQHLVINEIAPRVHNSGHWTIEYAMTSQFSQHIRAIAGWPLGSTEKMVREPVKMVNILGEEIHSYATWLGQRNTFFHNYGKKVVKPLRKMGHYTHIADEQFSSLRDTELNA